MSRAKVMAMMVGYGWYPWGKVKRYGARYMQCWRKGHRFVWVGDSWIEFYQRYKNSFWKLPDDFKIHTLHYGAATEVFREWLR